MGEGRVEAKLIHLEALKNSFSVWLEQEKETKKTHTEGSLEASKKFSEEQRKYLEQIKSSISGDEWTEVVRVVTGIVKENFPDDLAEEKLHQLFGF